MLREFAKQVGPNDGNRRNGTSVDAAALELAASRWADTLRFFLIEEFRIREATTRGNAGGLCGAVAAALAPQDEAAVREWLTTQASRIASGEEAAIDAALGILVLAFEGKVHVVPRIAEGLLAMLTGSAPTAHAAAWALAWSNHEKLEANAWRPSAADLERIISFVGAPTSDTKAVRFLTWILGRERDARAVEPLIICLENQARKVRQAAAEALGQIGDPRAVKVLISRLSVKDREVRAATLGALSLTCKDQADRKLLSRDFDALEPFLDPQKEIDETRIRRAAEQLGMQDEEVRHRYETLAQQFSLRLAW